MARTTDKLNALTVSRAKSPGLYPDGAGLYLQVTGDGKERIAKSWIFRYTRPGTAKKRSEMGLGSANALGLAEARLQAEAQRRLLALRLDPIEERDKARKAAAVEAAKALTFRQCADQYLDAHRAEWKNAKHTYQWETTIRATAGDELGKLPVASIDTALILRVLEPIWSTKPETARRLRGRLEAILDWATVRGYRSGENPARWKGHLKHLLANIPKSERTQHHPAMPYADIPDFMAALRAKGGAVARALEFTILTAARSGETRGASWREIDGTTWTIPGARMKAGKEHRVPLPKVAIAIIEKQQALRESDLIFPGARQGRPLSDMSLLMTLRRMGHNELTVHGFRSAFRDWAAERTSYPREVAEMALAHQVENRVEAAYRRGDLFEKRRRLMEEWAKFCASPKAESKVIVFRGNASE